MADSHRYSQDNLVKDGCILEVRISEQFSETMRQNVLEWILAISESLRAVYGHWPRHHWQIVVNPASARGSDPIPWAEVRRGEVDRVEFLTDDNTSADALKKAWTGYHELAHLLIPYRGYGDAWFSEGLATYYQHILQVRSGILSEQALWQKLYDGYQRGLADSRFAQQTLSEASEQMRREGGFMRVYWSGAWYFLAADTRLRQQSRGKLSLDLALKKLNDCCADASLSVTQIVRKLDDLNRVLLFQPLYEQLAVSLTIPSLEFIFASLGITVIDDKVQLQKQGPGVDIRRGITTGKSGRQPTL